MQNDPWRRSLLHLLFCCDNLRKSKFMALEKPGRLREFFLLLSYFVATLLNLGIPSASKNGTWVSHGLWQYTMSPDTNEVSGFAIITLATVKTFRMIFGTQITKTRWNFIFENLSNKPTFLKNCIKQFRTYRSFSFISMQQLNTTWRHDDRVK